MNIAIVGLGLIGGSLGLDLRQIGFKVFGVSRQQHTCELAIARGVADDARVDFSLLAAADVVFICTPIASIVPIAKRIIPHLSPGTILTDVGSVKTPVVEAITPIWPNFIGGHPMAGTTQSGIDAAQGQLFAGRPYVFTPVAQTPPASVQTISEIARSLLARVYHCSPSEHDRAVALISHLPVMVSASLIDACMSEEAVLKLAQQLASSGFRDTSRVGGGNPELGLMMAQYNRSELLRSLSSYRHSLEQLISHIQQEDWQALEQLLQQTQLGRSLFTGLQ